MPGSMPAVVILVKLPTDANTRSTPAPQQPISGCTSHSSLQEVAGLREPTGAASLYVVHGAPTTAGYHALSGWHS